MLSRAGFLTGQNSKTWLGLALRYSSTIPANVAPAAGASQVGFQRPVRQEPGKVRFGFLPEEWFTFFYKKTGVTGPYVFGFSLSTYLVSKEWYVLEHEFFNGIALGIVCVLLVKYLGPHVAKYADKGVDAYETSLNEARDVDKKGLADSIKNEKTNQWSCEGQLILVDAKRENVALQLEAAYRERIMTVYNEVTKRLEFQLAKQTLERRIAQKHMVDWVLAQVKKAITSEEEKKQIDRCIADLAILVKDPHIK